MIVKSLLPILFACVVVGNTPAVADDIVLDEAANGTTVTARIGQHVVVRLWGNPTTGYQWQVDGITGDAAEQVAPLAYIPDEPPITGSGGIYAGTFRAAREGTSQLTMTYLQPWMTGQPPAETFQVGIRVVLPADVTADDCVNVSDLLVVRNNLGKTGSLITPPTADVNVDGVVNVADLLIVRNNIGRGSGCS